VTAPIDAGELADRFRGLAGREPQAIWMAPGRVNLIGEHTDYNDGFVLPFALGQGVYVALGHRPDRRLQVSSARFGTVSVAEGEPIEPTHWAAYVRAGLAMAAAAGVADGGWDVVIEADLPVGAGLSSSAATLCAVLGAAADAAGSALPGAELARLARRAEVELVGVPVGPMDHLASACATAGHALFIDCRDLRAEPVPLDPAGQGLALLVTDTGTRHRLIEGEYAARQESCQMAAAAVGVRALRDTTLSDLEAASLDPVDRRRARHVVSEDERVLAAVGLLRSGRLAEVGPLLDRSHASLAADFEVSTPALDLAVAAARRGGALGSRLTGAGFGGSTISLVPRERVEQVEAEVGAAFADGGLAPPAFISVVPGHGARRIA
jgi:galactokinase